MVASHRLPHRLATSRPSEPIEPAPPVQHRYPTGNAGESRLQDWACSWRFYRFKTISSKLSSTLATTVIAAASAAFMLGGNSPSGTVASFTVAFGRSASRARESLYSDTS